MITNTNSDPCGETILLHNDIDRFVVHWDYLIEAMTEPQFNTYENDTDNFVEIDLTNSQVSQLKIKCD